MDQSIQEYLNKLTDECLNATSFSRKTEEEKIQLRDKLSNAFSKVILTTLVDNLNGSQLQRFNAIDTNSDKAAVTIEQLASEVPGFIHIVDDALKETVEKIKKSGYIPA